MTTRPGYAWDAATNQWIEIGTSVAESPVYFQATPPASAPTGSIWVDSDAFVPSIDSAQMLRWRKTMTGGQTSLSGTDDNGLSLQYTPGYEQLYINGVLQVRGQDYTATTGTTITGLTALVVNDVVEVFSVVARAVADVYTQSQSDSKYATNARSGLTLVVPGLVTVNSGTASVGTNGVVTFSGASGVILNNVFTSIYDSYRIMVNLTSSGTSQDIFFQLRAGTTAGGAMWYSKNQAASSLSTYANASQLDYWNLGRTSTNGGYVSVDLVGPAKGSPQRKWFTAQSSDADKFTSFTGGYADDYNIYDGFRITGSSGGVLTGNIKVYGYNNGA